jgi:hypothetical protein
MDHLGNPEVRLIGHRGLGLRKAQGLDSDQMVAAEGSFGLFHRRSRRPADDTAGLGRPSKEHAFSHAQAYRIPHPLASKMRLLFD